MTGDVGGGGGGGGNGGGGNDGGGGAIIPPAMYGLQTSTPFDCSELKWNNDGGTRNQIIIITQPHRPPSYAKPNEHPQLTPGPIVHTRGSEQSQISYVLSFSLA